MKRPVAAAVILLASLAEAQTPTQMLAATAPATAREMPAESKTMDASDLEVQQQIQIKLASDPTMEDAGVNVKVTSTEVVLSGTINDEQQRQTALRIAQSYAGSRKVVDRMRIKQPKK